MGTDISPVISNVPSTGLSPAESQLFDSKNITVSVKNGVRTVEGYDHAGQKILLKTTVHSTSPDNNGYRSQTVTVCDKLSKEQRKVIANKLKDEEKLTQQEIAIRLGVSQRTISSDLNA
jgi:DNA-directed RNA polymerase specialized sigma subunit